MKFALDVKGKLYWQTPLFDIINNNEEIYGILLLIKGDKGLVISPHSYRVFNKDGFVLQEVAVNDPLGIMKKEIVDSTVLIGMEAYVKNGSSFLEYCFELSGHGTAEIEEIQFFCGGLKENRPFDGPPYLEWIDSLIFNKEYRKHIIVNYEKVYDLPEDIRPYLEIHEKDIINLMPDRRPVKFSLKGTFKYYWNPLFPDVLLDEYKNPVDLEFKGMNLYYQEVKSPSGKVQKYEYYLKKKDDGTEEKIYVDSFMTSARINNMCKASTVLSRFYKTTGNIAAAIKAGVILSSLSKKIIDWPIYGRGDWNIKEENFYPADSYESWFSFIVGEWYTPSLGRFVDYVTNIVELIQDEIIWDEISGICEFDAFKMISDAVMHVTKLALKYDAFYRNDPWRYFHNTVGCEIRACIKAGIVFGCPELVHYGVQKSSGTIRYNCMADGMLPESFSYTKDIVKSISVALSFAEGYSDPLNYVAKIDNERFENFHSYKYIPLLAKANKIMDKLKYPDGAPFTYHDTWPAYTYPEDVSVNDCQSDEIKPFLVPSFGHCFAARGSGTNSVQAHLHYSGFYNHGHADMLNFVLWAYGFEMTADIGYSHLGGYVKSSISHNTVIVNGETQKKTHCGNLTAWFCETDGMQFIQADDGGRCSYECADVYKRTIILIPVLNNSVVIDIFEVKGGDLHEWMINGSGDFKQKVDISAELIKTEDNLSDDAIAYIPPPVEARMSSYLLPMLPEDQPGTKSVYYGAFRNARFYKSDYIWKAKFLVDYDNDMENNIQGKLKPHNLGIKKPEMLLHWIYPLDSEVILCEAPRNRYYHELQNLEKARESWHVDRMQKLIVRKKGKNLNNCFIALWEPYMNKEFLQEVKLIDEIPFDSGIGIFLKSEGFVSVLIYNKSDIINELSAKGLSAKGAFASFTKTEDSISLTLYDGKYISACGITVELEQWPELDIVAYEKEDGNHILLAKGSIDAYSEHICGKTYAGEYIIIRQEGAANRWCRLSTMKKCGDIIKLTLIEDPGFEYNNDIKLLKETYFPYRSIYGALKVKFPAYFYAKFSTSVNNKDKKILHLKKSGEIKINID